MSGARVCSSPDLVPMSTSNQEDSSLEGIATNVKLLLKLIHDHQEASHKASIDERKAQRFAGIMAILDDVKTRLQKSQPAKKGKELRRCNTDLRISHPPKNSPTKKNETLVLDEKEKLRRDLNTSYAAQKRLGVMCSSLGREKDIISRELTRKVQELHEMEEDANDLRAQNERLSAKVQACVTERKDIKSSKGSDNHMLKYATSQERNKELSEQLYKSLEGYKLLKKKQKEVQEERDALQVAIEEVREEAKDNINFIYSLKQCVATCDLGDKAKEIEETIVSLEDVFKRLELKTRVKHV